MNPIESLNYLLNLVAAQKLPFKKHRKAQMAAQVIFQALPKKLEEVPSTGGAGDAAQK